MERCFECESILGPKYNYCELCGSETRRFKRIQRAKNLSLCAKRCKPAEADNSDRPKSPDIVEEFDINESDISLIEETMMSANSGTEETIILKDDEQVLN